MDDGPRKLDLGIETSDPTIFVRQVLEIIEKLDAEFVQSMQRAHKEGTLQHFSWRDMSIALAKQEPALFISIYRGMEEAAKGPWGDKELNEYIRADRKIQAIKRYRTLTNADLIEAKAAIEKVMGPVNPTFGLPTPPPVLGQGEEAMGPVNPTPTPPPVLGQGDPS